MPKVVVTGPDKSKREFTIDRELTLGRESGTEIQILEEKASRRHCRFRPSNGAIIVEDLGSSNGTKVNGRKVSQQALKHGDVIMIGQYSILFEDEENRFDRTIVLPEISDADIARRKAEQQKPAPPIDDLIAKSSEPTISEFKQFDEERWKNERKPESHEHNPLVVLKYVGMGVAGIVVLAVAISVLRGRPGGEAPRRYTEVSTTDEKPRVQEREKTAPPPENIAPPTPLVVKTPVIPPKDPTFIVAAPKAPDQPVIPAATNGDASAELTKVLAERDRALAANNFAGARMALNQFIAATTDEAAKAQAAKELKETSQIIDAALDTALNEARQAAAAKKYRFATQVCTRLISIDPQGRYGTEARSILTRIDDGAALRYQQLDKRLDSLVRAGQLDLAHHTLESALDELGGTKWAEPVSAAQLQVLMARALVRKLDVAREKLTAGNKTIPILLPVRKLRGYVVRVTGAGAELRVGGAALTASFRDMSAPDFEALKAALTPGETALEEAYFWQLLGRDPLAQAALERALQNPAPAQAALAQRLISLLPGEKNLRIYDFSKWQHQSDWDALSGSWSTVNDKYVLESADGGDTVLRLDESSAISGAGLRVGFEFELTNPAPGAYFAFEFGANDKAVSLIFTHDSVTLHSKVQGPANEKHAWKLAPARVEAIFGTTNLEVTVNGEKLPPLAIAGLAELKGTLVFRVRESAAAIDNVLVRNSTKQ